jgi:hypothetical protein
LKDSGDFKWYTDDEPEEALKVTVIVDQSKIKIPMDNQMSADVTKPQNNIEFRSVNMKLEYSTPTLNGIFLYGILMHYVD